MKTGFVFPIYAWGPPSLVLKVIKRLEIEGGERAYCYMVCTCGDDTGCTTALFRRALKAKGWKLSCGFSLAMPNTYVCLPGFDVDSAEMAQAKVDATRKRLPEVCRILQAKSRKSLRGKPGENAAPEKLRAASAVQQISRQRPSVSQQRSMQRMLPVPEVMSGREHPNERRASPMAGTVHRLPAMLPPLSPACH